MHMHISYIAYLINIHFIGIYETGKPVMQAHTSDHDFESVMLFQWETN
jgi:hypothetical protein